MTDVDELRRDLIRAEASAALARAGIDSEAALGVLTEMLGLTDIGGREVANDPLLVLGDQKRACLHSRVADRRGRLDERHRGHIAAAVLQERPHVEQENERP